MSGHDQYNIEGIVGLTGSGKSTFAMWRGMQFAARRLVPVYTNIGFDIDAVRHHALRRHGRRLGKRIGLHRLFVRLEDSQIPQFWNHVEPNALIILDEAQVFFPQTSQRTNQSPELARYLTQHRKLQHSVWWITQFPTLVSHDFRKVTHKYWTVKNTRQVAANFGICKVPVPVDGFFYCARYREEDGEIIEQDRFFAGLPWNRWVWDCFASRHLHGGLERLRAEGVRSKIGALDMKALKRPSASSYLGAIARRHGLAALALGVALMNRGGAAPPPPAVTTPVVEAGKSAVAPPEVRVVSVGGSSAILSNHGTVRVGDNVNGFTVRSISEGRVVVTDAAGVARVVAAGGLLIADSEVSRGGGSSAPPGDTVVADVAGADSL